MAKKSKNKPKKFSESFRIAEVEGSIPFESTNWTLDEHLLFQRRLCRDGVALMSK